jgi:hypothetical protein
MGTVNSKVTIEYPWWDNFVFYFGVVEQWNEGESKQIKCNKEAYCLKSFWRTCYAFVVQDLGENIIPSNYNCSLEVSFNIFK